MTVDSNLNLNLQKFALPQIVTFLGKRDVMKVEVAAKIKKFFRPRGNISDLGIIEE